MLVGATFAPRRWGGGPGVIVALSGPLAEAGGLQQLQHSPAP